MSFDKNKYLDEVLQTHKMHHIQKFVDKVKAKREEIKQLISDHYGSKKYTAFNSGSIAKHTATNVKFDMDVVEPFKHDSFDTLQNMFDDVYSTLAEKYGDVVRKQKVSIGLEFPKEDGDELPVQIDVVPGRELSDDDYNKTKDLNLCFNEDYWGFKKGSYTKTNISKQIEHISGKTSERRVIRLLKIWKKHKEKEYKSFLLELICIKALDGKASVSLWDDLKTAMEYIRDNIAEDSFHLFDPGNGNNDVVAAMDSYKRHSLKSDMDTMLRNIEVNEEVYLPFYFPKNEKYEEKEEGYKQKEGFDGTSYPKNPQRFG